MDDSQTISEILERVERAVQRVVHSLAALSPEQMQAPLLGGDRSVKDLLAHIAWWDEWLVYTLPPDPDMVGAPVTLPLVDQIPASGQWADAMNAKVLAYNKTRELADVQAEFAAARNRLLHRVAQLTNDDLAESSDMAAKIGQSVGPLVHGIYEHYEEHAHELEQLLEQLRSLPRA